MSKSFQSVVRLLNEYWSARNCAVLMPYDIEVGAGTFHPATVFHCLGSRPWRCIYVQPSRRPTDGRFGMHPNRLYRHHQMQVLLKPAPSDIQDEYLNSLKHIGIDPSKHDIRFVEDDWESPTLGASGLGWEVWCDGMEVSQFTYIQKMGGIECDVVSVELTYGLERLLMYIQGKDNVYDLDYNDYKDKRFRISYGDIFKQYEVEWSKHAMQGADTALLVEQFKQYESECNNLVKQCLALPAYEYCMKCSHVFNLMDARGAISIAERAHYILRVRELARSCCEVWMSIQAN